MSQCEHVLLSTDRFPLAGNKRRLIMVCYKAWCVEEDGFTNTLKVHSSSALCEIQKYSSVLQHLLKSKPNFTSFMILFITQIFWTEHGCAYQIYFFEETTFFATVFWAHSRRLSRRSSNSPLSIPTLWLWPKRLMSFNSDKCGLTLRLKKEMNDGNPFIPQPSLL